MRKFKCGLAVCLAVLLLIGISVSATDYEQFQGDSVSDKPEIHGYFPDVSSNATYAEAVNTLAEMGIFTGDESGNFNPNSTITRAEFAAIMCRLLGEEQDAQAITAGSFADVPSSHWACGYVAKAVELGLVSGYGDGRFGPSDTLTYEQAVKVLVCAIGYEEEVNAAGGYPNGYISVADELGITNKVDFEIGISATRGATAQLTWNTIKTIYGGE